MYGRIYLYVLYVNSSINHAYVLYVNSTINHAPARLKAAPQTLSATPQHTVEDAIEQTSQRYHISIVHQPHALQHDTNIDSHNVNDLYVHKRQVFTLHQLHLIMQKFKLNAGKEKWFKLNTFALFIESNLTSQ
jgi:hypothetical protein